MELNFFKLSVLDSPELESSMSNISYKQFKRTYTGGPTFNFTIALSGRNDFDVKTYTNFYLTDKFLLSDIINFDTSKLKAQEIATSITRGTGNNDYLVFTPPKIGDIGYNYGLAKFNNLSTTSFAAVSTFNLQIFDNNICRIFVTIDYRKFFLAVDDANRVYFVKEPFLPNSLSSINPQDFNYLFSTRNKGLLLFKDTLSGFLFLTQTSESPADEISDLVTEQVILDNNTTYLKNSLKISRDLYYTPAEDLDFNFITYKEDNTIDLDKSKFNLKNNFLLHKKYSDEGQPSDIIVLKNQLHQNEVFSSSNSLLSSTDPNALYVDDLREYTSICGDIKEELSHDLLLNYVFFNKVYEIKPGKTEFRAPSSLFPFTKLGINDSKFIDSGAFSYVTPEFADKVYRLSNQKQNLDAGQYLLCTWLSGSVYGDKVWMDRYFYPDLIRKEDAIALKPFLAPTYDDIIENLIKVNTTLREDLLITPIFDKISDMVFEPDQKYVYERLEVSRPLSSVTQVTKCDVASTNLPINYFKNINKAGVFTMYLTFDGDNKSWVVYSDRNSIQVGVTITKTETDITVQYILLEQTTDGGIGQDPDPDKYLEPFVKTVKFKPLKVNYLSIGVDTFKGEVYFTINNELFSSTNGDFITVESHGIVKKGSPIDIRPYEFSNKSLLYGDFFINEKNNFNRDTNLLLFDNYVRDFQIFNEFLDPNLAFVIPILNGDIKVDTIYISLPCGMRNSIDNIDLLQHICASSSFKSNNINILLKNLNIDDANIVQGIKNTITSNIDSQIPANTNIIEIKTENYL